MFKSALLAQTVSCLCFGCLLADPPRITPARQPQSQCIINGQIASFSVGAQGSFPLSYQWSFNGVDLPDKTNATLQIRPARPENGGEYQVLVRNAEGEVASLAARLHVLPPPASLVARVYTNSANRRLPYRLWIPTNHLGDGPLPLVLFMHGAGERGSDNLLQLTGQPHALSFVSCQNQEAHPCFFVAPQCPTSSDWSQTDTMNSVAGVLSNLVTEFPIDRNRLYMTGLSMGGYGTWSLLWAAPGVFAAAAPICGGGSTAWAPAMVTTPIWDFHSADDGTVAVSNSRTMVDALRRQGAPVIYTEYASAGHGSWVPAYSTQHLIDWMMNQRLGEPLREDPQLLSNPPATADVVRTQAGSILSGQALAFGDSITNLVWTNLVLHAGGKALAADEFAIPDVVLGEHITNVVVLTAKLGSWAPQYGGNTTFSRTLFVYGLPAMQLSLRNDADLVQLAWTGGETPCVIQTASDLVSGKWSAISTNAAAPIRFRKEGQAGFFRFIFPK